MLEKILISLSTLLSFFSQIMIDYINGINDRENNMELGYYSLGMSKKQVCFKR
jgi:hypothetical protein